ncbi:membrane dipeptidase [Yeosuana sp. MJ-SS3]|uniref:Membrane dipeptidase n=1 Tax=Gilvirhabdus luticola TaxID=3079858 RepID=A0ABU3U4I4_9FLAO|nr:membrane dipeptidase [Yeosuana sp. MJ-SS3]MDU8885224.1 membrane dipeptidase [Yeosuana sp. MJ-SS3]
MKQFQFADLHCHPTLKAFGKSFSKSKKSSSIWHYNPPNFFTKLIQKLTGITKFSQADFCTMTKGNIKIAFVSFYPFEKGFFKNSSLNNKIVAVIASFITSIGYKRVRYIQKHQNYFEDLIEEYIFLMNSKKTFNYKNEKFCWKFFTASESFTSSQENEVLVVPTIEGAHVFNSGLTEYGRQLNEREILNNIQKVKSLKYPPVFITFAHNFNNDFCGHAPSLEPLKGLVNQSKNLDIGFTTLGYKVIDQLLKGNSQNRILIDLKHMSLQSRLEYYRLLDTKYNNDIPIIVSHGAVTGRNLNGKSNSSLNPEYFANDTINFYDEELIYIARSKGMFAVQLDSKRLAPQNLIKKPLGNRNKDKALANSALIVWRQIQHVAEILDAAGLPAWETCCIGSDFDGTINPLNEIWTSEDFNKMANKLLEFASDYLKNPNTLTLVENKTINPEVLVSNFCIHNTCKFLNQRQEIDVRDYVFLS